MRLSKWLIVISIWITFLAAPAWAGQLTLTWTDNSNNEDGFNIYTGNKIPPHNTVYLGTVGRNVTTYIDTTAITGTEKCYGVTAFNSKGESAAASHASLDSHCAIPLENGRAPNRPVGFMVTP